MMENSILLIKKIFLNSYLEKNLISEIPKE